MLAYDQGSDPDEPKTRQGDVEGLRDLLGELDHPTEDLPGGATVTVGGRRIAVRAVEADTGARYILLSAPVELPEFADDDARLRHYSVLTGANYGFYIGKFGVDEDGQASLSWGLLRDGVTSEALSYYLDEMAEVLTLYQDAVFPNAE